MKTLVAYFSATGVTKKLAAQIAKHRHADLFEIKPAKPYTPADLDWTNKQSRSSLEMKDTHFRPEIAEKLSNMADYDTVFLGFPIWWYIAPTIINTFLEQYDFSGKTIIPFATSGGSGMGRTVEYLQAQYGKSITWKQGSVLNRASDSEIASWLDKCTK